MRSYDCHFDLWRRDTPQTSPKYTHTSACTHTHFKELKKTGLHKKMHLWSFNLPYESGLVVMFWISDVNWFAVWHLSWWEPVDGQRSKNGAVWNSTSQSIQYQTVQKSVMLMALMKILWLSCLCFAKEQEVTLLSVVIEDETLKRSKTNWSNVCYSIDV